MAASTCRPASIVAAALLVTAAPSAAADFWTVWGDGKAELSGYRLSQPRYGKVRAGTAVLIYVTEDLSDTLRVKADPGRHDPRDVYPVLKLNAVRKFQTGIYDYSVMTSVFARVDGGERRFSPRKVSFSAQEWCGHVYHQLLPHPGKLVSHSHSYFDGEADDQRELPRPADGVLEDELPILLRSFAGKPDYLAPGASRTVPFLPSLLSARLLHRPLIWGKATLTRKAGQEPLRTPAGAFSVVTYTVAVEGGERTTYHFEAAPPHRLVSWRSSDGQEAVLLGSTRLPYWQLNGPGQEAYLKELGLGR